MPTGVLVVGLDERRTPHGVRGLKSFFSVPLDWMPSRTPHGVRGLKYVKHRNSGSSRRRTPHGVRGLK